LAKVLKKQGCRDKKGKFTSVGQENGYARWGFQIAFARSKKNCLDAVKIPAEISYDVPSVPSVITFVQTLKK
jgi:hypothetical protein